MEAFLDGKSWDSKVEWLSVRDCDLMDTAKKLGDGVYGVVFESKDRKWVLKRQFSDMTRSERIPHSIKAEASRTFLSKFVTVPDPVGNKIPLRLIQLAPLDVLRTRPNVSPRRKTITVPRRVILFEENGLPEYLFSVYASNLLEAGKCLGFSRVGRMLLCSSGSYILEVEKLAATLDRKLNCVQAKDLPALFFQVIAILGTLELHGISHNDVKLDNLLFLLLDRSIEYRGVRLIDAPSLSIRVGRSFYTFRTPPFIIKLIDFGIATFRSETCWFGSRDALNGFDIWFPNTKLPISDLLYFLSTLTRTDLSVDITDQLVSVFAPKDLDKRRGSPTRWFISQTSDKIGHRIALANFRNFSGWTLTKYVEECSYFTPFRSSVLDASSVLISEF